MRRQSINAQMNHPYGALLYRLRGTLLYGCFCLIQVLMPKIVKNSVIIFQREFLNLNDRYMEKDLENSIMRELEQFFLEFGTGFSFLAHEILLAFINTSLKLLVVVLILVETFL